MGGPPHRPDHNDSIVSPVRVAAALNGRVLYGSENVFYATVCRSVAARAGVGPGEARRL